MAEPTTGMMMGAVLLLAALSLKDLMVPTSAQLKPAKDIPAPKLASFAGPSVRFLYCYS